MIRTIYIAIVFCFVSTVCYGQSQAHKKSKFAIVDPAYNSTQKYPTSEVCYDKPSWIYGAGELECFRLQLLRERSKAAKLKVNFPGVFHEPFQQGEFRLQLSKKRTISKLRFNAVGEGKVYVNEKFVVAFPDEESSHQIDLKEKVEVESIRFELKTNGAPVALLISEKKLSTSFDNWEWRTGEKAWETAFHFLQNKKELPPHAYDNPEIHLKPIKVGPDLFDFGRELMAYIEVKSEKEPVINVGESKTEALDINCTQKEQPVEMVEVKKGQWKTKHPMAFRYLYAKGQSAKNLSCSAIFHPATYKGAFACSDSILTRIWMNSAYTLRLCMSDFLLDGIKRDRLPWTGDLAMSMYANAYSFRDPELVRRSLVALGRAGIKQSDINGIIDYSLWWIIAQDQYQLYYGDLPHLKREWMRIREALKVLNSRCDNNGFLIPKGTWLFIDWVKDEKWTALQILWWWSQKSAAKLAHRMGDEKSESYWNRQAADLKVNLKNVAWNKDQEVWLSKNNPNSSVTRHPNFLAIVSGLTPVNQAKGIQKLLEGSVANPVGTPYMAGFEMMALARLGNTEYMLNHVNEYWGRMLKQGATTFWEAYDASEKGKAQYAFYNRPYAKSLCHAWSAGPAVFLPAELLGLKPVADGWKRFSLKPEIANLTEVNVCVPTKYGNITVDVENKNIKIRIPAGTTLEWNGEEFVGPKVIKRKL
ncbi:hypothetical protein EMN47_02185 [Prolixibacteraceae bacterium JC049]|nr:hypothetical protein [Prolixibacteraceae bacterium JC049]